MGNIREYKIVEMTNMDKEFYPLIGPFLARREIIKALGEPIYDDDDKQWFIALDGKKQVLGFAAAVVTKTGVQFSDSYVLPDYREQGIFTDLINARLAKYKGQLMKTIANGNSVKVFKKHGFKIHRETVNYYFMQREA